MGKKGAGHPHTNMAKAALNMLTCTSAGEIPPLLTAPNRKGNCANAKMPTLSCSRSRCSNLCPRK